MALAYAMWGAGILVNLYLFIVHFFVKKREKKKRKVGSVVRSMEIVLPPSTLIHLRTKSRQKFHSHAPGSNPAPYKRPP